MKRNRLFLFATALFATACAVTVSIPASADDVLTIDSSNSPYSPDYEPYNGSLYIGTQYGDNFAAMNIASGGTMNNNYRLQIDTGGSVNNSGTLFSKNNLIVDGGTLNNLSGGALTNDYTNTYTYGWLNIHSGGAVNNSSTITNNGYLTNYGAMNNLAGGTLTIKYYTDQYNGFYNYGALDNSGLIYNYGTLTNNPGTLTIKNGGTLSNGGPHGNLNNAGQLTIDAGGTLNNGASLHNVPIVNGGSFFPGVLTNNGTLNNSGDLSSETVINGTGVYKQTAGETTIYAGSMSQGAITINGGAFAITPQSKDIVTIAGAITNNSSMAYDSGAWAVTGGFSINRLNSTTPSNVVVNGPVINNGGQIVNYSNPAYTPPGPQGGFTINESTVEFTDTVTNNLGASFVLNQSNVTFDKAVFNYGTWISDPSTIIFMGDFTNTGTLSASDDTYEFLGAGTHYLNLGTGSLSVADLILGAGVVLNITGAGTLTFGPDDSTTTLSSGFYTLDNTGKISSVPIPGTLLLLVPGLAGLALFKRKYMG